MRTFFCGLIYSASLTHKNEYSKRLGHTLPLRKYTISASNVFVIPQPQLSGEIPLKPLGKDELMRKRNVHIQFWLNESEAKKFNQKVERSRLPRETYLRHLINGLLPNDAPPPDFYDLNRELHFIGTNMNQIARKANALNIIDEYVWD